MDLRANPRALHAKLAALLEPPDCPQVVGVPAGELRILLAALELVAGLPKELEMLRRPHLPCRWERVVNREIIECECGLHAHSDRLDALIAKVRGIR